MTDSYVALALQVTCPSVAGIADRDAARQRMMRTLEDVRREMTGGFAFIAGFLGEPPKLVQLPEYFLTAFPGRDTLENWRIKAAIEIDGPEYEAMGRVAQDFATFLSGNVYEVDPHFPEIYFQTCFVIAPNGDVVLRYRRMISMYAPSPYDVWDAYLDRYGIEGVFPVADTEIGKLGAIASEEILYPEIGRMLGLRGAEVLLHPTSETSSPQLTVKDIAKRARAIENMAYVVSANSASIEDAALPGWSSSGMSKVVDYKGLVLAEAGVGPSMTAKAWIDLAALRKQRALGGMHNMPSRLPLDAVRAAMDGMARMPANGMLTGGKVTPPADKSFFRERQEGVIAAMRQGGAIR